MKKLRRIYQSALLAICFLGFANNSNAQVISPNFFGQNAWMPYAVGDVNNCTDPPCVFNGQLDQHWADIKNSKAQIIRYGGIAVDKNMPTNAQYIAVIDSIRANGMEPIIEVPYYKGKYNAQDAAGIVQYINVTKAKGIKYWIIANEPDFVYPYTTSTQVANYIRPFASAMKAVDPTILIIGPETAWYDQNIINGLTTANGPDDITGKDANGRYYIDILSFHAYGFDGTQTRADVISKLTGANSFEDHLNSLNARLAICNSTHNRTGNAVLKTAVTEANVDYQNDPSDNLYGVGANSFIGGQYIAEMYGIGMKKGVSFINMWSVIEGNTVASNCGYIDPSTHNKKPIYYHFQLLAENFRGTYADGTTNQVNVKSFGCKDAQQISVMILNEDISNNYNYTVNLNTTAITGTSALKININAGVAAQYTSTIPSQSSVLLTFNSAGTIIKKTEYSLLGNAVANTAPTVTNFNITTGIVDGTTPDAGVFELKNVFPNPAVGKFTVEINRGNFPQNDFQVQLFNLLGQEVFNKKLTFLNGKEEVELDGIAAGEYILRVKEGSKENYLTKKVILEK